MISVGFVAYDIQTDSFILKIGKTKVLINCASLSSEQNRALSDGNCTIEQLKQIKAILNKG